MTVVQDVNAKLAGSINFGGIMNGIGWLIAGILFIAAVGGIFWYYYSKKQWTKRVTRFELIGDRYEPTFRDQAKNVKLGKGGFEVLFWKKAGIYRIAFGSRVGKADYYFFTAPDGYDYNGFLGREITTDGRVPIITTNPSMRAQYTALEKQIDALHGEKQSWLQKYGLMLGIIGFVLIVGIFFYLYFKQYTDSIGQLPGLIDKISVLVDNVNRLMVTTSSNAAGGTNLVPVT